MTKVANSWFRRTRNFIELLAIFIVFFSNFNIICLINMPLIHFARLYALSIVHLMSRIDNLTKREIALSFYRILIQICLVGLFPKRCLSNSLNRCLAVMLLMLMRIECRCKVCQYRVSQKII